MKTQNAPGAEGFVQKSKGDCGIDSAGDQEKHFFITAGTAYLSGDFFKIRHRIPFARTGAYIEKIRQYIHAVCGMSDFRMELKPIDTALYVTCGRDIAVIG